MEQESRMKQKIGGLIATRADHSHALEVEKIFESARQAGVESEAVSPFESAFVRAGIIRKRW